MPSGRYSPQKSWIDSRTFFVMGFFVYILYSALCDKYYVGQTDNLDTRLASHNSGNSLYTSRANDWVIVYTEELTSRTESRKRELEIKRKKVESILSFW